ncbi:MAG: PTS sugar transporter subunit IIA, partial [Chitinispirillaceae bacterium]|nr:PTS sugar transporter subunit IIA [Chitinispirillaceae bacterium]
YRELASFSQFSSDLDQATKDQLARGERLMEVLKQRQYRPVEIMHQVMTIFAATNGYLDRYPVNKVAAYERHLHIFLDKKYYKFMEKLNKVKEFTEEIKKEAIEVLEDFATMFDPSLSVEKIDEGITPAMSIAISQSLLFSRDEIIHMIEKATARELKTPSLDRELTQIVKEHDSKPTFENDPFINVISKGIFFDFEENNLEILFKSISQKMSQLLDVKESIIFERLIEREKSGSTALTPIFAVPHIMIDGQHKFSIAIVRSKKGVFFTSSAPDVHAIFFLIGTIDERKTHLNSLAGIAQVVSHKDFIKMWSEAESPASLRDIIIKIYKKQI